MSKDTEEISKFHQILRENKLFYPIRKVYNVILGIGRYGFFYEMKWVKNRLHSCWTRRNYYKCLALSQEERERQKRQHYDQKLCFSILVPLFNTPEVFLREMIESVQNQTYTDWELCLADGSDSEHSMVEQIVREYQEKDLRISYRRLEKNGGISVNTNECMKMATGDYIVLFDHDDLLHEAALYELRTAIDQKKADFIYTDEAVFSKDFRKPDTYHFKPDFAWEDLRSNNYICHITCFSKELLSRLEEWFRSDYDGSQDFDLVLRLAEKAQCIVHIPKILYYWRCHELSVASDISAKTYCIDAGRHAVQSHLQRMGISGTVESSEAYPVIYHVKYDVLEKPFVSIIITGDKDSDAGKEQEERIRKSTSYPNYEILFCAESAERNQCASRAKGEYLLFLESYCYPVGGSWLEELLGVAQRKENGAVGGKVLYSKGMVRDFGMTLGIGVNRLVGANYFYMRDGIMCFIGTMYFTHNVSAVSDNAMMIAKEHFWDVKGFDEELPVWYAGLDLSLKLREKGLENVCNPYAEFEFCKEEHRRMEGNFCHQEKIIRQLQDRWHEVLVHEDPYYNRNLTKYFCDYTIGRLEEINGRE